MRSLVISLVLFALILSAIVLNAVFVRRTAEDISDIVTALPHSSSSAELSGQLSELWSRRRGILSLTARAKYIKDMDELILSLGSSVDRSAHSETKLLCELINALCEDLCLYERISFHSIL